MKYHVVVFFKKIQYLIILYVNSMDKHPINGVPWYLIKKQLGWVLNLQLFKKMYSLYERAVVWDTTRSSRSFFPLPFPTKLCV